MKPRLILADDVPETLHTYISVLQQTCEIVAAVTDGRAALSAVREYEPDVAVLDIAMPGLNGIEVARIAIREQGRLAVILCSVIQDATIIRAASTEGVRGYVNKGNLLRDLPTAVSVVANGGTFFPHLA